MSISFHMRAWKQDFFCLSIYRSAILPVSVLHPFPSSHNILNVCSVHSCTVLSCVWLYQTYYAVFTSILFSADWFLLFLGSIWLLLVLLLLFFAAQFCIRHSFMDTWLSRLHWEFENNQLFPFVAAIPNQTVKSLDRTEWMYYSDLEIDAIFFSFLVVNWIWWIEKKNTKK